MRVITFFIIFVIGLIRNAKGQEACTTNFVTNGYCVKSDNCPPIKVVVDNVQKRRIDSLYIKESYCGKIKGKPQLIKVCCSKNDAVLGCILPDPEIFNYTLLSTTTHTGPEVPIGTFIKYNTCDMKSTDGTPNVKYLSHCQDDGEWSEVEPCTTSRLQSSIPQFNVDDLLPNECGVISNNIFGIDTDSSMNQTYLDDYPWMALIEYRKQKNVTSLFCAASLISKRYLVTAAHCVVGDVLMTVGTPINIHLGEYDKTTDPDCIEVDEGSLDCNDKFISIAIEKIIPHPDYKPNTDSKERNDIALIRIKNEVSFGYYVFPVCLPKNDLTTNLKNQDNTTYLVVSGWGSKIGDLTSLSNRKLQSLSPFVQLNKCINSYSENNLVKNIWDKQLCVGREFDRDPCIGDSGGPLVHLDSYKYNLIGVMSFGSKPCGLADVPIVYTNVYKYLDWIRSEIKP